MTSTSNPISSQVQSAQDFIKKYNLKQSISGSDILRRPNVSLDEVTDDYEGLDFKNKYAVFIALKNLEQLHILRKITHFSPPEKLEYSQIQNSIDTICSDLENSNPSIDSAQNLWEKRLAVQETLYKLQETILFYSAFIITTDSTPYGWNFSIQTLLDIKDYIQLKLIDTYKTDAEKDKNSYWDSDNDFDPYNSNTDDWDLYFDDKDCDPLVDLFFKDSDQDGVDDTLDYSPHDKNEWIDLSIGDFKTINIDYVEQGLKSYELKRLSKNKFKVATKFPIYIEEESTTLTDEKLKSISQKVSQKFTEIFSEQDTQFIFEIEIYKSDEPSSIVTVTNHTKRNHALEWHIDIFEQKDFRVIMHEIGHHFGFPDYYDEKFVFDSMKDRTLLPGFKVLADGHLMRHGMNIKSSEIKHLILTGGWESPKQRFLIRPYLKTKNIKDEYISIQQKILLDPANPFNWLDYLSILIEKNDSEFIEPAFERFLEALKIYIKSNVITEEGKRIIHDFFMENIMSYFSKNNPTHRELLYKYDCLLGNNYIPSIYEEEYSFNLSEKEYLKKFNRDHYFFSDEETLLQNSINQFLDLDLNQDPQIIKQKTIALIENLSQENRIEFIDHVILVETENEQLRPIFEEIFLSYFDPQNYSSAYTYIFYYECYPELLSQQKIQFIEETIFEPISPHDKEFIDFNELRISFYKDRLKKNDDPKQKALLTVKIELAIDKFALVKIQTENQFIDLFSFYKVNDLDDKALNLYYEFKKIYWNRQFKPKYSWDEIFDKLEYRIDQVFINKLEPNDEKDKRWIERYYYKEYNGFMFIPCLSYYLE